MQNQIPPQVSSAYRSPLEVVVQRFVQQRPLAASLCPHQRDVDVVIRPCKPLVPSGNSHCVAGHGGGKMASDDGEHRRRANLLPLGFFLKPLENLTFPLAPVATEKRLTYAPARVTDALSALPLRGENGGLPSQ